MSKTYHFLMTGIFCGFLGGVLILSTLLPDKKFSELENRNLSTVPTVSVENIRNGTFMEQVGDYAADHIAGRDLWVAMKAWCERLSGKQENNGAYLADQETLINQVETPDTEKLLTDLGHVNKLVEHTEVPVYFGLIPTAAAVWADRLPEGAPTADEAGIINTLYANSSAINLDMLGTLMTHKDEAIFYRTDHHWTSLGAGYGANAIFEAMGLDPVDLEGYDRTVVSEDLNGTTFSSSGVRWLTPDSIETFVPEDGVRVTSYLSGKPEEGQMYVESQLEKKDKYSFFLGGNQPLCVLESEKTDGPKLLVIRDSYSDALAPFLTERFSEVHLFDVRYNMMSIQNYVEANGIDQVLVLYSFSNFVQENNLFLLGR